MLPIILTIVLVRSAGTHHWAHEDIQNWAALCLQWSWDLGWNSRCLKHVERRLPIDSSSCLCQPKLSCNFPVQGENLDLHNVCRDVFDRENGIRWWIHLRAASLFVLRFGSSRWGIVFSNVFMLGCSLILSKHRAAQHNLWARLQGWGCQLLFDPFQAAGLSTARVHGYPKFT